MKTEKRIFVACVAALGMLMVALPKAAHDDRVTPPAVPDEFRCWSQRHSSVTPSRELRACPRISFAWNLFTPEATLFNDQERQVITHCFSVIPILADNGAIRRGGTPGTRHRLGGGDRCRHFSHGPGLREGRRDCLASRGCGWTAGGTEGWRQSDTDHFHSACEHRRRLGAFDGLCRLDGRRGQGVRAVHR